MSTRRRLSTTGVPTPTLTTKYGADNDMGTVDGPLATGVRLFKNLVRARLAFAAPLRCAPVPLSLISGTVKLPTGKAAGKALT